MGHGSCFCDGDRVADRHQALRDRLRSNQLDEIVLVGGATRMPMVRKLFDRFPVVEINPDEAVAQAAAIQAALKARNTALKDVGQRSDLWMRAIRS